MDNLFDARKEEEEIEARIRQRESEILAEIDGRKNDGGGNATIILAGLAIAVVLALPALGIVALSKGKISLPSTSTTQVASAPAQVHNARPIVWYYTLQEGLNAAAITGKPIMIDFYTTWCGPCKTLDAQTFADSSVMAEAQNFIAVKVDADLYTADAQRYGVRSYPTVVWTDAAGNERTRISGAYPPDRFLPIMQQNR